MRTCGFEPAAQADLLQGQEGLVEVLALGDAVDLDLLDQVEAVGVERGQAVDQVGAGAVGGAVAQGEERVQGAQRFLGLLRFHVLRLVQDQDRARLLEVLVGQALAGQLLGRLEDHVGGLVEGVERDDQDLDEGGGGEGAQLAQAAAVVLDQVDGLVAVEGAEVVTRDLEVLDPRLRRWRCWGRRR